MTVIGFFAFFPDHHWNQIAHSNNEQPQMSVLSMSLYLSTQKHWMLQISSRRYPITTYWEWYTQTHPSCLPRPTVKCVTHWSSRYRTETVKHKGKCPVRWSSCNISVHRTISQVIKATCYAGKTTVSLHLEQMRRVDSIRVQQLLYRSAASVELSGGHGCSWLAGAHISAPSRTLLMCHTLDTSFMAILSWARQR